MKKDYLLGIIALISFPAAMFTLAMLAQGTATTVSNIILAVAAILLGICLWSFNSHFFRHIYGKGEEA